MIRLPFLILLSLSLFISCKKDNQNEQPTDNTLVYVDRIPLFDTIFTITADVETDPVQVGVGTDAADDPAVWIHPSNPALSIVFGSNKKGGIAAYNLDGQEIKYTPIGEINNIDVAYNLQLATRTVDICGGTNRTTNAIDIFEISADGTLDYILKNGPESGVNEVYGFCFYHSPTSDKNYAILCGKNGVVEHYEILEGQDSLGLNLVSSFDIGGQCEGMVADHKHGYLYVGEEDKGIWKLNAEPSNPNPVLIPFSSKTDNVNIKFDIEGLTIFYTSSDHGFLIASSQGNNSFAIYDRSMTNDYIGSFSIGDGQVDGTEDTDGIDVVNLNLGSKFPNGLFIAQDGENMNGTTEFPQNFKLTDWKKISDMFSPPLYIDKEFNLRSLF